ncbi:unnamed protein product [Triticum turgidum subsp. durum]|uniref:Uncharacterized protein n=1 Tax=Triticum turgidum subsp. durum TaxID=4567 RepID=A0A9R1SA48_TRITD|nr:unnamed protein product [Triticum turgidum subsp. durum]
MELDAAKNFTSLSPCTEFSGDTPVDLRGLKGTSLARYANYVQSDLRNLKRLLSEYPVNKASVVSEITADLALWGRFFKDPPFEVARLMKGLASLREANSRDTSDLTGGIALQREKIQQWVSVVKTSVDKVSISCNSMDVITTSLEGGLDEQETRQQGYLSRATAIRAQILELQLELQEIEENSSREQLLKDQTDLCLSSHQGRVDKVKSFKIALENCFSEDQDKMQQLDKITEDFKMDKLGFTKHMYSLHEFFHSVRFRGLVLPGTLCSLHK